MNQLLDNVVKQRQVLQDATMSGNEAHIMSDESRYLPIFKFDKGASQNCYPDWPSSQNDKSCTTTFNSNAPVFYQVNMCGGHTVYTYWLWYGRQNPCIRPFDKGHGDDWEHISVYANQGKRQVDKVIYYQHKGFYTRRRGTYESEGERPVIYVGKTAHGSYHAGCTGKCSAGDFFAKGCLGSVHYCQGGCGYWDDFRNPGLVLRNGRLYSLRPGEVVEGITRPNRQICVTHSCEGANTRDLNTAGCWQNMP